MTNLLECGVYAGQGGNQQRACQTFRWCLVSEDIRLWQPVESQLAFHGCNPPWPGQSFKVQHEISRKDQ